jgi:hypothetical protein
MPDDEKLRAVTDARAVVDDLQAQLTAATGILRERVREAFEDGHKTGPVSHAARWSDTQVRAIRDGRAK